MKQTAQVQTPILEGLNTTRVWRRCLLALVRPGCIALLCFAGSADIGCRSAPPRLTGHAAQSFTGVGANLNQRAAAAIDRGDFDLAERLYRQALTLRRKKLGPKHPEVARSLANLAWVRHRQGQYAECEELEREALAIRRKMHSGEHPDVARSLTSLGACLTEQARYRDAELALTEALTILRQMPEPPHPYECVTLDKLVKLYEAWGQPDRALVYRLQRDDGPTGPVR